MNGRLGWEADVCLCCQGTVELASVLVGLLPLGDGARDPNSALLVGVQGQNLGPPCSCGPLPEETVGRAPGQARFSEHLHGLQPIGRLVWDRIAAVKVERRGYGRGVSGAARDGEEFAAREFMFGRRRSRRAAEQALRRSNTRVGRKGGNAFAVVVPRLGMQARDHKARSRSPIWPRLAYSGFVSPSKP